MRYFEEKRPTVKIYLHHYGKKELESYAIYARVLYKSGLTTFTRTQNLRMFVT